ncbi:MAG: ABC transporter ATP-binding protein/permease [Anaerolineae bacterium]|nr:ABC transporter ATP-binding protein/permease [Anaerolineae bacterium]
MSDYGFQEEEFESKFNGGTFLRILEQVKPHWRWVAGFVASVTVVSILNSVFTMLGMRIVDDGITAGSPTALQTIAVYYGALVFVQAAFVFIFIFLTGILGHRVQYELRQKMFKHLQTLSLSYYNRTPVGWIMSRMTSDAQRIADLVTWGMLDVTWAIINIVTAFIFMLTINWQLALIVFTVIPVLVWVAMWFERRIVVQYRIARKANSKITGAYNENITGVRVVKAMNREARNLEEFGGLTDDMFGASFRAAQLSALFLPSVQLISAVALGAIVLYGGGQVEIGGMTVGGLQAFISYVTFMLWPVQDLARVFASMQQAIASAERVFSLVDASPDVVDKPESYDPGSIRGDIVFDDVTFWYEPNTPILKGFNLTIKQGETVALVGPTGAGKSTLVNLVCRFFEPQQGRILIGGHDYRDYTQQSIQSRIGMVLQTPHLFSGSIRENIRYGRLAATDDEVVAAATLAGAHEFIMALEKGYDGEVGEGGNRLSVGQKQLISLARAVLAEPEIFVMDEATSSVDTLTEALIQRGMETMTSARTSFIIAHRLSTIRRADRILVIEDGGVSEMGTHAELIRARGHYYRLYTQQFRREMEEAFDKRETGEMEKIPA